MATLLTLVVIPVIYMLVEGARSGVRETATAKLPAPAALADGPD